MSAAAKRRTRYVLECAHRTATFTALRDVSMAAARRREACGCAPTLLLEVREGRRWVRDHVWAAEARRHELEAHLLICAVCVEPYEAAIAAAVRCEQARKLEVAVVAATEQPLRSWLKPQGWDEVENIEAELGREPVSQQ